MRTCTIPAPAVDCPTSTGRTCFTSSLVYNLPALEGRNRVYEGRCRWMGDQHRGELATGNALTVTGGLRVPPASLWRGEHPWSDDPNPSFRADPWGPNGNGAFTNFSVRPTTDWFLLHRKQAAVHQRWVNGAFTMNGYVIGQRAFRRYWTVPWPEHPGCGLLPSTKTGACRGWVRRPSCSSGLEFFNLFNHPMFRYGGSSLDSNQNLHFVGQGGQIVNGVVTGTYSR